MENTPETMSPSIAKLALALSKAQGELNGVVKDSDNPFFKSKYADLHTCIQASKDPLAKNELAVIQTTKDSDRGVTIVTTLAHSSGEWIRGELTMKPKKDDDQGRGSSITYGRRYSYAAIIGLAQRDDDGNEAVRSIAQPTTQSGEQETLQKWLDWIDGFTDKNIDTFLASWDEYGTKALGSFKGDNLKIIKTAKAEMDKYLSEGGEK